jgi:hypothetical protein
MVDNTPQPEFFAYTDVGLRLLQWGYNYPHGTKIGAAVKGLTPDKHQLCIFAAMLDAQVKTNEHLHNLCVQLQAARCSQYYAVEALKQAVQTLQDTIAGEPTNSPSNGMLMTKLAAKSVSATILVASRQDKLSVRARNALANAKIRFVGEISRERLAGIPGCGLATTAELLEFRRRIEQGEVAAT